jgi:predicted nucleic acid-binding protein
VGVEVSKPTRLKRKSFFVDERVLGRAKRLLRASSDAEASRLSLERVAEMERYWQFMDSSRGRVKRGAFEEPWVAFAILDTSVYIDHWERSRYSEVLAAVRRRFVVRQSAVVLSELRRGARTKSAVRLVEALRDVSTVIWEPNAEDWWRAGKLIRAIGDAKHWETTKRRAFQNDALIALTAVRHGATVVTTNADDFELLAKAIKLRVEHVST